MRIGRNETIVQHFHPVKQTGLQESAWLKFALYKTTIMAYLGWVISVTIHHQRNIDSKLI